MKRLNFPKVFHDPKSQSGSAPFKRVLIRTQKPFPTITPPEQQQKIILTLSRVSNPLYLQTPTQDDDEKRMSKGVVTHPMEFKQLMELRLLYEKYGKKDLNILAFPSTEKEVTHEHTPPQYNVDSILRQPKEAQEDIKQVIHDTFKVMSPIHLNTINEHEVFAFLKEKAEELEKKIARHPEQFEGEDVSVIQMFTKFLVNRKGQVVARFGRDVEPDQMNVWIEQLLAEKP
ncbi:hypothetical protein FDP41_002928 [Naegleria fowleri]|uniref:Thioredoxin-like fold domain-containing protein n=1 Tax=Naegleria fowleri TaxID=5763 RepID=A0A6A5BS93_NAEFO|nr:uncharacterized protein FDP41_002928 [Naegleria fowleri]KAF0978036.1 hypothetical protein FDP41_002928 [Naegleria fowleri]